MRRRAWLLLLLTLAAATAAVWYWSRRAAEPVPTAVEFLSTLPADTTAALYVDLAELRASPLIRELLALAPGPARAPEYAEFVQATGFDYERDLDRAALARRAAPASPGTILLAEGRLDREKITEYALRTGRRERQGEAEVLVVPAETASGTLALSFLSTQSVLLADGPQLGALLAESAGNTHEELKQRILRVAGSPVFVLGRVPPPAAPPTSQIEQLLASIRWFSLAARPEAEQLHLVVDAECDSPEDARRLTAAFDTLRLLARAAVAEEVRRGRLQPQAAETVDRLLRQAAISESGAIARLRLTLTRETLTELAGVPADAAK